MKLESILRIIEKLSIKQMFFSILIVLSFTLLPQINFLESYILPLENNKQWLNLVFCTLIVFFILESLFFLLREVKYLHVLRRAENRKKEYLIANINTLSKHGEMILKRMIQEDNPQVKYKFGTNVSNLDKVIDEMMAYGWVLKSTNHQVWNNYSEARNYVIIFKIEFYKEAKKLYGESLILQNASDEVIE